MGREGRLCLNCLDGEDEECAATGFIVVSGFFVVSDANVDSFKDAFLSPHSFLPGMNIKDVFIQASLSFSFSYYSKHSIINCIPIILLFIPIKMFFLIDMFVFGVAMICATIFAWLTVFWLAVVYFAPILITLAALIIIVVFFLFCAWMAFTALWAFVKWLAWLIFRESKEKEQGGKCPKRVRFEKVWGEGHALP
jgi:hypothetical protein